jgi:adenylosuccinate synthase
LLLDEDRLDQWPHVTRSKTGLVNVLFLARRLGLERLRVTYVSRTYLTRHGAGPLAGECDWSFTDRTNMPNAFQGSLRFAPLDQRMLRRSIEMDFQYARLTYPDLQGEIAFTCADQLPMQTVEQDLPVRFISYGRTRDDVQVEKRVPASRALVRV